ncbi:MAG: lipase family protein [Geitlerinemataceae cyanobacterium]
MEMFVSPHKSALDRGNAYWMARCAKAVYKNGRDEILEQLRSQDYNFHDDGFQDVRDVVRDSGSEAALIEHELYVCIAFRGTNDCRDWLKNLSFRATEQLFGKFHSGFWSAVEDVWNSDGKSDGLWAAYEASQARKPRPLFLTGHSLGGAMASIAAARLVAADVPFTSAYTFGQPRATIAETVEYLDAKSKSRFFRFENNNDIVTKIPSPLAGYRHNGTHLYITTDKQILREPSTGLLLGDSLEGLIRAIPEQGLDFLRDHGIADYISSIEESKPCFEYTAFPKVTQG